MNIHISVPTTTYTRMNIHTSVSTECDCYKTFIKHKIDMTKVNGGSVAPRLAILA